MQVVLLAPPRSEAAADYLGEEATKNLESHVRDVANRLDLPVFMPQSFWPNEFFVDQAHLNRRGRQRFCAELAEWSSKNL